jgi:hypothetical protein
MFVVPPDVRFAWFAAIAATASLLSTTARAQEPASVEAQATARDGRVLAGRLVGDGAGALRFQGRGEPGPGLALRDIAELTFTPTAPGPGAAEPPFRVLLGHLGRVSGRLDALDEAVLRLADAPDGRPCTIPRSAIRALIQRPGEAVVLRDDFEALEPARWTTAGDAAIDAQRARVGRASLRLPAGGASAATRLDEPVASGRVELAYFDDGRVAGGQRAIAELSFERTGAGTAPLRLVVGWIEEMLAVEAPRGPLLAVQQVPRRPGWHRIALSFGPDGTDVLIDDVELAHGDAPPGPLAALSLATQRIGAADPPRDLAIWFDDLRIARRAEPSGPLEAEPDLDEMRLVEGDQLFGRILGADAEAARLAPELEAEPLVLPWSRVAGLYFRRDPQPAKPVEGLIARVAWRAGPGRDLRAPDELEGAVLGLANDGLLLDAPYLGRVAIPKDRLLRLTVLGRARRWVLDPTPHHLGDRYDADLDPPQPDGDTYALEFTLDAPPAGPARLALDVVDLIGVEGTPPYSELVRRGELLTRVFLNDRPLADLNTFVNTGNETPERVRVPIPEGVLRAGRNRVRIEQTGTRDEPHRRDNFGLLGVALEWPRP